MECWATEFLEKTAGPIWPVIGDLAGLGILAVPNAYHLATGKDLDEKTKDVMEIGGLGTLAATQLPHLIKRGNFSPRAMNYLSGGVGGGVGFDLAHNAVPGVSYADVDQQELDSARTRARAIGSLASLGLGTAGALAAAGFSHPMDHWFTDDTGAFDWGNTVGTAGRMSAGASLGLLGQIPAAVSARRRGQTLLEEAAARQATPAAPPIPVPTIPPAITASPLPSFGAMQ